MTVDLRACLETLAVVLGFKAAIITYVLLDRRRPKSQLQRSFQGSADH